MRRSEKNCEKYSYENLNILRQNISHRDGKLKLQLIPKKKIQ